MESKIAETLKTKVKDSSTNLYMNNLKRLNDNQDIKSLTFLKDTEKIFSKIEKYKPNTQKSYLISIVSVLKDKPNMKKVGKIYYDAMMKLNGELKVNNTKTDTQKENWISQEEVKSKLEELKAKIPLDKKKINAEEYKDLLNYFVLSLYVLQSPRRNLDYQDNIITRKSIQDIPTHINITDLETGEFIFSNYKTEKKYKTQRIPFSEDFKGSLDLWLKYHPLRKEKKAPIPLLCDFEGQPFKQNNDITRILNKIFGKKIGVSMLRNIFLTDKFGGSIAELKETTTEMGTSPETAENNYIKVD